VKALQVSLTCAALCLTAAAARSGAGGAAQLRSGGNFNVEVVKDLAYDDGADADPVRHRLDLYLPKGQKGFPVLLYVHGGGWTKGSKEAAAKLAHTLARNGIGTAATNYRLTPQVKHPAHARDVAKAFAWVRGHIAKYGGRPDEMFLSGHSAGGHLVALLATDPAYLTAEKLSLGDIKGVIPISGVYTLKTGHFKGPFGADADGLRNASPLTHVKGKHPPFLILYADKDGKDFDKMAEEFGKAIKNGKGEAATLMVRDRTHGSIVGKMVQQDDPALQAVLVFVARHSSLKLADVEVKKAGS
jgi:acetyl esterase/lipase